MQTDSKDNRIARLSAALSALWTASEDRDLIASTLQALDGKYDLSLKIEREPGVQEILAQMAGRLGGAFKSRAPIRGKRILDIACGSNTSRAPDSLYINTPIGENRIGHSDSSGYTALFEPWFCRLLLELGADPVGIDLGDLSDETFEFYRVDLGKIGTLDFLPDHSFDAVQDSRLFGSPEFVARFPERAYRLHIAGEIRRQEHRLLKQNGIVVHSDAEELLS